MRTVHKFDMFFTNGDSIGLAFEKEKANPVIKMKKTKSGGSVQNITLSFNEALIMFGELSFMMHTKEFSMALSRSKIKRQADSMQRKARLFSTYKS